MPAAPRSLLRSSADQDCVYGAEGQHVDRFNLEYGDPELMVYDYPGCICNHRTCILDPQPGELG